jgi:DNA-binding NarL/FixJ family response regulator
MSAPGALETPGLELVLIDAGSTPHLMELLVSFRRLRPRLRLVVIGDHGGLDYVGKLISMGARGVLSHEASEDELRTAIEVVRDGSVWAPRKVLSRLLDLASEASPARAEVHLTRREVEILQLLMRGMPNREIARALEVETATVKAHLARLMRKAGVANRTALGVHALASKWV